VGRMVIVAGLLMLAVMVVIYAVARVLYGMPLSETWQNDLFGLLVVAVILFLTGLATYLIFCLFRRKGEGGETAEKDRVGRAEETRTPDQRITKRDGANRRHES
jgi:undecaprenyl pyrophosphate phosphatase UppP